MLFILLLSSVFMHHFETREILVKDLSSISYLESIFLNNLSSFPEDFIFIIHLTRVPGLLFYSIDRNFNQLIVKIHDEFDPFITIEFNLKKYLISLKKLCNCELCLHEKLKFRFLLNNGINAQCNDGEISNHKFSPNQQFQSRYPVPNFNDHKNSNISAFLWMINTPEFEISGSKFYPDNEYITGCIFQILHNNISVKMKEFGTGISGKCSRFCNRNVCNGGKCLETFKMVPLCDCFETFRNGDFCNSTHMKTDMKNDGIQFEVLKISWNSYLKQILSLKNKYLELVVEIEENQLCFKYVDKISFIRKYIKIFPGYYLTDKEYILIITLEFESIKIQVKLHQSTSWTSITLPVNRTLNKENFNNITFLNNSYTELGEIVFKVSKIEKKWTYIGNSITKTTQKNYSKKSFSKVTYGIYQAGSGENIFSEYPVIYLAVGAFIGILFTIGTIIVIVFKCQICIPRCIRNKLQRKNTQNDEFPKFEGSVQLRNGTSYSLLSINPNRMSRIDL